METGELGLPRAVRKALDIDEKRLAIRGHLAHAAPVAQATAWPHKVTMAICLCSLIPPVAGSKCFMYSGK